MGLAHAAPAATVSTGSAPTAGPGGSGQWRLERVCSGPVQPGYAQCHSIRRIPPTAPAQPSAPSQKASDAEPIYGYGPADLASAYDLPAAGGDGVTVAVVAAFDNPTAEADLAVYRAHWGLPPCTTENGCFKKIDQRGGQTYPIPDETWAGEISLDLDAVSAVCPRCHLLLVEADSNSAGDLGQAVDQAVANGAQVVSNSYGGPEHADVNSTYGKYYQHPGVAIVASSGDYGYGMSFPASSPYVTAVGGTTLARDDTTGRGWTEQVWNNYAGAPGSGCSTVEPKPYFQADPGCRGRSVADVSALADPLNGLAVYQTFGGYGWAPYGGTSLAAPIIAGVYALAGRTPAGDTPNWYPYAASAGSLNDITEGRNGICDPAPAYLCTAGEGFDGPTGLGTPNGVAAFRAPGPHGHLAGTVTDATSHAPVANATVTVSGGGPAVTATTDAAGRFAVTRPTGTFNVAVTAFGYADATRTAEVTDGQTATVDVALRAQPLVTLSGTVTDGSGHGWPLYATVSAPGTPLQPVRTDPFTGRYRMRVPVQSALSLRVKADAAGYRTADAQVTIDATDVGRDLAVPVDDETCTAAGYHHNYAGLPAEPFDSTEVPAGWRVDNATENGWEFNRGTVIPRTNETTGSGNFALIDTQFQDRKDTTLTTPPVDLADVDHPVIGLRTRFVGYLPTQSADVGVSTDGGATWSTVWKQDGLAIINGPLAVPIPQAAHHRGVLVRFHYAGQFARYWELDDVYVGTRTCDPVTGGIVAGRVLDATTGDGVDGATVTAVAHPDAQATSVATPDDDTIGDGYFALFAPGGGDQRFTASARNRVSSTRSVHVSADTVNRADFSLAAAALTIRPASVTRSVRLGDSEQAAFTVTNSGSAPAHVSLVEQPGGFTPVGGRVAAAAVPVRRVPGVASGVRHAPAGQRAVVSPTVTSQPAMTASTSSAAPAWAPMADYPGGPIMDNAMARGDDGKVYVVGGTHDGYGPTAKGYVYDPVRLLWSALPDLPVPVQKPVAAFVSGRLVVAGGWGPLDAVTDVQVYDPVTKVWTRGASMPAPRAAAGSAVLDSLLYVVSGCATGDCAPATTTVLVYDAAHDRWSSRADYPASEAFMSCGGLAGRVVCAGGVDITTGDGSAAAHSYDPRTDAWTRLADLPTGWWGAASTVANGQLLLSGGVAGGTGPTSSVTNEGHAYDPMADAWHALPNAPAPFYRGAAACGVYRVGGALQYFEATASGQELPGYDICGPSGDVPWLSASRDAFTLRPGESRTVTLKLDAGNASTVDQPGDYRAAVAVRVDGPVQPTPVQVTMHVDPPKRWGRLSGTVSGAGCSGTVAPLSRATVTLRTKHSTTTLWTDEAGHWSVWADKRDSPVTLVYYKDGFSSLTRTIKVRSGSTVNTDIVLQPARC
ncbi:carboxypeptidase regulatory-like domain-containing protein [Micromonospora sp. MA102]|uniref:carboxypeptidase regulatory-like domain-containing protein n=1 Tax=Micromonospora sp. MA102 TaxID=2952755 RepID=UPI0021CA8FDB|nr:carboxypeptidase regulatory-like domain-containing protein [Micromonospora sp. MA102]